MKLFTFEVATPVGPFERLGALDTNGQMVDLNFAMSWRLQQSGESQPQQLANVLVPAAMLDFIQAGAGAVVQAKESLLRLSNLASVPYGPRGEQILYRLQDIVLKAPLPNPPSLRDFFAFEAHVKAGFERRKEPMPEAWYELPVYYKGNHRSILGPTDPVVWPRYTEKLDYELELACIIGKAGRDIQQADARSYIFGYTVMNDWSARDIQVKEMSCRLGPAKGKDFATSLGPCIVTADEMGDPATLVMIARVNAEEVCRSTFGTSHWTFEQMIAYVSQDEMVYPGDVFGSGTVGGGAGFEIRRWIQPGDVVELEVPGIGILSTRVITHEMQEQAHVSVG